MGIMKRIFKRTVGFVSLAPLLIGILADLGSVFPIVAHASSNRAEKSADASFFVKTKGSALRKEPKMNSEISSDLALGESVKRLKVEGLWSFVSAGNGREGWIFNHMLSDKTIVSADAVKAAASSQDASSSVGTEKKTEVAGSGVLKARERPRMRSATMGVRGLMADSKTQELSQQEANAAQAEADKKIEGLENQKAPEGALKKFKSELVGPRKK
jgi:hypothetical protein